MEEKGIKGNELSVASALILGYKDNIDAQLKNAYSSAGAMHVLAVSGLHVGVIFLIFNQLLGFFEKFIVSRLPVLILIEQDVSICAVRFFPITNHPSLE